MLRVTAAMILGSGAFATLAIVFGAVAFKNWFRSYMPVLAALQYFMSRRSAHLITRQSGILKR